MKSVESSLVILSPQASHHHYNPRLNPNASHRFTLTLSENLLPKSNNKTTPTLPPLNLALPKAPHSYTRVPAFLALPIRCIRPIALPMTVGLFAKSEAILKSIVCLLLLTFGGISQAQIIPIYLQLEDDYSKKILKYTVGQEIEYTTIEYPDAWRKEKIERIIPEENTIVLSEGFLKPADISKVRTKRKLTTAIGNTMITGAQAYYLYGIYGTIGSRLDDDPESYTMRIPEMIGGAIVGAVGWLIKKLFKYKTFHFNQHTRLRIMDIRFTTPEMQIDRA